MAIIVEGFDNSGKSTLARAFGLEVVHPGPRPQNVVEEYDCLTRQVDMARMRVVMDRITCVSTPCYTGTNWQKYAPWLQKTMEVAHCVVIYCRPPLATIQDFSRHICKGYDEAQQVQWLIDNAERIVDNYDLYMSQIPHMQYDYTKPDQHVITSALNAQLTYQGWEKWHRVISKTP